WGALGAQERQELLGIGLLCGPVSSGSGNLRTSEQLWGIRDKALVLISAASTHNFLMPAYTVLIKVTTLASQGHLLGPAEQMTFVERVHLCGLTVECVHAC